MDFHSNFHSNYLFVASMGDFRFQLLMGDHQINFNGTLVKYTPNTLTKFCITSVSFVSKTRENKTKLCTYHMYPVVFFLVICRIIAPKNLGQRQAYRKKIVKLWMKLPKNFKFKKNLG